MQHYKVAQSFKVVLKMKLTISFIFFIKAKEYSMENSEKKKETPEIDKTILEINKQREREKEEKFVNLIIEIIVSATLREYYEKSNKIPTVQPTRTK